MSIPSIAATDMGSNKSSEKPVTYAELHHMMDRLAAGPGLIGDQYWAGKAAALASDVNAGFVATNP